MLLKRIYTSRGHGIHSPLAYELVTQVLCSASACYYASPNLPSATARRWLRVAVRFNPREIIRIGQPCPQLDSVFGVLSPGSKPPLTVAVNPSAGEVDSLARSLPTEGAVMLVDTPSETVRAIAAAHTSGLLTFSGRTEHYLVRRSDLPRQHFDIILR